MFALQWNISYTKLFRVYLPLHYMVTKRTESIIRVVISEQQAEQSLKLQTYVLPNVYIFRLLPLILVYSVLFVICLILPVSKYQILQDASWINWLLLESGMVTRVATTVWIGYWYYIILDQWFVLKNFVHACMDMPTIMLLKGHWQLMTCTVTIITAAWYKYVQFTICTIFIL